MNENGPNLIEFLMIIAMPLIAILVLTGVVKLTTMLF